MSKSKSKKTNKAAAPAKTKPVPKKTTHAEEEPPAQGTVCATAKPSKETKLGLVIKLLSRPEGATLADLMEATGWQPHTVRAALSHALGKKRGYQIVSDKPQGGLRIYKIANADKVDH